MGPRHHPHRAGRRTPVRPRQRRPHRLHRRHPDPRHARHHADLQRPRRRVDGRQNPLRIPRSADGVRQDRSRRSSPPLHRLRTRRPPRRIHPQPLPAGTVPLPRRIQRDGRPILRNSFLPNPPELLPAHRIPRLPHGHRVHRTKPHGLGGLRRLLCAARHRHRRPRRDQPERRFRHRRRRISRGPHPPGRPKRLHLHAPIRLPVRNRPGRHPHRRPRSRLCRLERRSNTPDVNVQAPTTSSRPQ